MRYGMGRKKYHGTEASWEQPTEHVDPLGVSDGFGIRFELEAWCSAGVGTAVAEDCRA